MLRVLVPALLVLAAPLRAQTPLFATGQADPIHAGLSGALMASSAFGPGTAAPQLETSIVGDVHGLVTLGGGVGMGRFALGRLDGRVGVEASVDARFRLLKRHNDMLSNDWRVAGGVELARGATRLVLRVGHERAHLGDEYMQATGARRRNHHQEYISVTRMDGHTVLGGQGRIYGRGRWIVRSARPDNVWELAVGGDWAPPTGRSGATAAVHTGWAQRWDEPLAIAEAGYQLAWFGRTWRLVLRASGGPMPVGELEDRPERALSLRLTIGPGRPGAP